MVEKSKVNEMLNEEIKKVKDIGIVVEPISPVVEYSKSRSTYAVCVRRQKVYNGEVYKAYIKMSEYFLGASEIEVRACLMHEVLHACKRSWGCGHGKEWKELARRVNKAYGYKITRLGAQLDGYKDYDLSSIVSKRIKYVCVCTKCGTRYERSRMSNMVMHPELYYCGVCSGKLRRET